jgi:hypothetical protein
MLLSLLSYTAVRFLKTGHGKVFFFFTSFIFHLYFSYNCIRSAVMHLMKLRGVAIK